MEPMETDGGGFLHRVRRQSDPDGSFVGDALYPPGCRVFFFWFLHTVASILFYAFDKNVNAKFNVETDESKGQTVAKANNIFMTLSLEGCLNEL